MPILNSFKNSLQMPRTKSGFKNYQRIIALVLAIVFSAEQVSYAGRLDDTWSSIKSTLRSKADSVKTTYNTYSAIKSATGLSLGSFTSPLSNINIKGIKSTAGILTTALTHNPQAGIAVANTNWTKTISNGLSDARNKVYNVGVSAKSLLFNANDPRTYVWNHPLDALNQKITSVYPEWNTPMGPVETMLVANPGGVVGLGAKSVLGYVGTEVIRYAPSLTKIPGFLYGKIRTLKVAETSIQFVDKPSFWKNTAAELLPRIGSQTTPYADDALKASRNIPIQRLYPSGRITTAVHNSGGLISSIGRALTYPERHLVTPYISSNAGRWLVTYPIRYAEYELGLYAFRKSGLEDALIPMTSAYRPAWDTTRDYILPFFIAPGRGGIAKETTKAFFTPGGVKTFAQTGVKYLSNLKNQATFSTLKSAAETIPAKLTRESIKSGIVNAGKAWTKEARTSYVKLGTEGGVWKSWVVPVQMARQGVHVAQDLAVFSAGTAVASGTLNKAGVKRIEVPFTSIGVDTLEFKNLPHALNTISEYSAGGAISGLIFGSAMSIAGPAIGPVISRTPVLGRFMRWYDDTYGNKLFETAGLEKRLAGKSFLSKQGISFINKFNRAQNFLAEEFWVFREPLAGAAFSSLPMPAGAQEYLEESITDYGKRGTGSISFGLGALHNIQAEGGVKEFIAKKIGGIADALGEIKLPNPLPPVAAAASITAVTPMPEQGVPQAAAYSVPIIEPKTPAQPTTFNPNPVNTFSSGWDSPVIQDNRPTVNYFDTTQQKIEPQVIIAKFQDTYEKQRELFLRFTNKYDIIGIAKLKTIDALTSTFNEGLKNQGLAQVPETWIKENLPAHYKVEQGAGKLFITNWFNHNVNGGGNYAEKDWLSGGKIEGLEDYLQHGLMSLNKYKQVSGKDISYAELKDTVRSSRVWLTAEVDTAIRYSHSNSNFIGEESGLIFVFDKSIVKNFDQKVQVSDYAATIKDQAPWNKIKYILIPQKHYTKAIDILKATHPEWNHKAFAEKQLSDILVPVAGDNIEQYEINAKITLSKLYAPSPKPALESSPAIPHPNIEQGVFGIDTMINLPETNLRKGFHIVNFEDELQEMAKKMQNYEAAKKGLFDQIKKINKSVGWGEKTEEDLMNQQENISLLAKDSLSNEVVGYANMYIFRDYGYIPRLATRNDWQRNGIATKIFYAAVEQARIRGLGEIQLEFENNTNIDLYKFYKNLAPEFNPAFEQEGEKTKVTYYILKMPEKPIPFKTAPIEVEKLISGANIISMQYPGKRFVYDVEEKRFTITVFDKYGYDVRSIQEAEKKEFIQAMEMALVTADLSSEESGVIIEALKQIKFSDGGKEWRPDENPVKTDNPPANEPDLGLCLTPDSLIELADGAKRRLIEIKAGDSVLSLNQATGKLEPHKVKALLDMGVKPVYRLTTQSGKSLKTTLNHPYLTKSGWRKLKDIKAGEEVAAAKIDLSPAIGVFPGINSINNNNKALNIETDAIFSDSESMGNRRNVDEGFGKMQGVARGDIKFNLFNYSFLQLGREFFEFPFAAGGELDIFEHQLNYDNPNSCLIFSKGTNPNFLASLMPFLSFSANFGLIGRWASMASISQPMGLWNTYSLEEAVSSNLASQAQSKSHSEYVSNIKYLGEPFLSTTAAALKSLGKARPDFLSSPGISANFSNISNFTGSLADNLTNDLDFISLSPYDTKYTTSILSLSRFFLSEAQAAQPTDTSSSSDILWDKIVSIEPIGSLAVYDIEVEGTHNFVAEGIVAHNTYISSQPLASPPAKLDSAESIKDALSKIKEQTTELKGLNEILGFIIENYSLHEKDKQNNPVKLFSPERIHEELLQGSLKDLYQNLTEEERAQFLRILDDQHILPLGGVAIAQGFSAAGMIATDMLENMLREGGWNTILEAVSNEEVEAHLRNLNHGITPFIGSHIDIRLFTIHEKVEILAMSQGATFQEAHKIALEFEKRFRRYLLGPYDAAGVALSLPTSSAEIIGKIINNTEKGKKILQLVKTPKGELTGLIADEGRDRYFDGGRERANGYELLGLIDVYAGKDIKKDPAFEDYLRYYENLLVAITVSQKEDERNLFLQELNEKYFKPLIELMGFDIGRFLTQKETHELTSAVLLKKDNNKIIDRLKGERRHNRENDEGYGYYDSEEEKLMEMAFPQIGKRAEASEVIVKDNKKYLKVTDTEGKPLAEIELIPADNQGLIKSLRDLIQANPQQSQVLKSFLEILQKSPPEFYTYFDRIEDLFGYAKSKRTSDYNLIAIHEDLAENPIAIFHEIGEYLIDAGFAELKLNEANQLILTNKQTNQKIEISLTPVYGAMAIADKHSKNSHYLLRALQRELFREKDTDLTKEIKKKQEPNTTFIDKTKERESDEARRFLEERINIKRLQRDFKPIIEDYGYTDFKELYLAAGEGASHLFDDGLSFRVQHLFSSPEEFKLYWPDLVRLSKAAGKSARFLFRYELSAIGDLFSPEEFKLYWVDLMRLSITASENNIYDLFSDGLPTVKKLITNQNSLNAIGSDLIRLGKAAGADKNALYLFRYGLPVVKDLISDEKSLNIIGDDLVRLGIAAGENLWQLFQLGLPAAARLITNQKSLNVIGNDLIHICVAAGKNAGDLFRRIRPRLEYTFVGEFSQTKWQVFTSRIISICSKANDYNRERIVELLFEEPSLLNREEFDFLLDISVKVISEESRLSLQALEGIKSGIEQGLIQPKDIETSQNEILSFVRLTHSFSPALFSLYKREGEAGLKEVFSFSEKILSDGIGEEELLELESYLQSKGIKDTEESILSAIQIAIPSSGASFVKKEEIKGLFAKYRKLGDKRGDVPVALANKDFGDGSVIDLMERSLREGAVFDPKGEIKTIISSLRQRHEGLSKEAIEEAERKDKEAFKQALLIWFSDFQNKEKQAQASQKFYAWASHSDTLKEKVDAITDDYSAAVLLEALFTDKDNLSQMVRKALDTLAETDYPVVASQKEIPNIPAFAKGIRRVWEKQGLSYEEKEAILQKMLTGYSKKELLDYLRDDGLKQAILRLPDRGARIAKPQIIEALFSKAYSSIQQEKAKFTVRKKGEANLEFRVVKGIPYGLWGLDAGVCIATDLELFNKKEFFLLAIIDKTTKKLAGFAHLFEKEINGKKVLTVPGIEPSVEFLSEVKAEEAYPLIEQALIKVAKAGGYSSLYLPQDKHILSNRSDITRIALRKYESKKLTLAEPISWNTLPQPYPFKEVYVIWEAQVPQIGKRAEVSGVIVKDNKNYLRITDTTGKPLAEIELIPADNQGLIKSLQDLIQANPQQSQILKSFLEILQKSPPEFYTYSDTIEDLFGYASRKHNLIALHKDLAENPIAIFHEIGEYLIQSQALNLKLEGNALIISINGEKFSLSLQSETLAIAQKDPANPHYLLRALQREVFGEKDRELTEKIKELQSARVAVTDSKPIGLEAIRQHLSQLLQKQVDRLGNDIRRKNFDGNFKILEDFVKKLEDKKQKDDFESKLWELVEEADLVLNKENNPLLLWDRYTRFITSLVLVFDKDTNGIVENLTLINEFLNQDYPGRDSNLLLMEIEQLLGHLEDNPQKIKSALVILQYFIQNNISIKDFYTRTINIVKSANILVAYSGVVKEGRGKYLFFVDSSSNLEEMIGFTLWLGRVLDNRFTFLLKIEDSYRREYIRQIENKFKDKAEFIIKEGGILEVSLNLAKEKSVSKITPTLDPGSYVKKYRTSGREYNPNINDLSNGLKIIAHTLRYINEYKLGNNLSKKDLRQMYLDLAEIYDGEYSGKYYGRLHEELLKEELKEAYLNIADLAGSLMERGYLSEAMQLYDLVFDYLPFTTGKLDKNQGGLELIERLFERGEYAMALDYWDRMERMVPHNLYSVEKLSISRESLLYSAQKMHEMAVKLRGKDKKFYEEFLARAKTLFERLVDAASEETNRILAFANTDIKRLRRDFKGDIAGYIAEERKGFWNADGSSSHREDFNSRTLDGLKAVILATVAKGDELAEDALGVSERMWASEEKLEVYEQIILRLSKNFPRDKLEKLFKEWQKDLERVTQFYADELKTIGTDLIPQRSSFYLSHRGYLEIAKFKFEAFASENKNIIEEVLTLYGDLKENPWTRERDYTREWKDDQIGLLSGTNTVATFISDLRTRQLENLYYLSKEVDSEAGYQLARRIVQSLALEIPRQAKLKSRENYQWSASGSGGWDYVKDENFGNFTVTYRSLKMFFKMALTRNNPEDAQWVIERFEGLSVIKDYYEQMNQRDLKSGKPEPEWEGVRPLEEITRVIWEAQILMRAELALWYSKEGEVEKAENIIREIVNRAENNFNSVDPLFFGKAAMMISEAQPLAQFSERIFELLIANASLDIRSSNLLTKGIEDSFDFINKERLHSLFVERILRQAKGKDLDTKEEAIAALSNLFNVITEKAKYPRLKSRILEEMANLVTDIRFDSTKSRLGILVRISKAITKAEPEVVNPQNSYKMESQFPDLTDEVSMVFPERSSTANEEPKGIFQRDLRTLKMAKASKEEFAEISQRIINVLRDVLDGKAEFVNDKELDVILKLTSEALHQEILGLCREMKSAHSNRETLLLADFEKAKIFSYLQERIIKKVISSGDNHLSLIETKLLDVLLEAKTQEAVLAKQNFYVNLFKSGTITVELKDYLFEKLIEGKIIPLYLVNYYQRNIQGEKEAIRQEFYSKITKLIKVGNYDSPSVLGELILILFFEGPESFNTYLEKYQKIEGLEADFWRDVEQRRQQGDAAARLEGWPDCYDYVESNVKNDPLAMDLLFREKESEYIELILRNQKLRDNGRANKLMYSYFRSLIYYLRDEHGIYIPGEDYKKYYETEFSFKGKKFEDLPPLTEKQREILKVYLKMMEGLENDLHVLILDYFLPQLFKNPKSLVPYIFRKRFGLLAPEKRILILARLQEGKISRAQNVSEAQIIKEFLILGGVADIKVGQMLSTRRDLIPEDYRKTLSGLTDEAPVIPFEVVFDELKETFGEIITTEKETGKSIKIERVREGKREVLFENFYIEPFAAGSIAQVHLAFLPNGDKVVVKVIKPEVAAELETGLKDWLGIAEALKNEPRFPIFAEGGFSLGDMFKEYFNSVKAETDLRVEAENIRTLGRNLMAGSAVSVPIIYHELSGEKVLTISFAVGRPIDQLSDGQNKKIAERFMQEILREVFEVGAFHADPHRGNVFVDEKGRITLIDMGMIGRLKEANRGIILELLWNLGMLQKQNEGGLVGQLLRITKGDSLQKAIESLKKMGQLTKDFNEQNLHKAIQELFAGQPQENLQGFHLVSLLIRIAGENGIQLDSVYTIMLKTLYAAEGVVYALDPGYNLAAALKPIVLRYHEGQKPLSGDGRRGYYSYLGHSGDKREKISKKDREEIKHLIDKGIMEPEEARKSMEILKKVSPLGRILLERLAETNIPISLGDKAITRQADFLRTIIARRFSRAEKIVLPRGLHFFWFLKDLIHETSHAVPLFEGIDFPEIDLTKPDDILEKDLLYAIAFDEALSISAEMQLWSDLIEQGLLTENELRDICSRFKVDFVYQQYKQIKRIIDKGTIGDLARKVPDFHERFTNGYYQGVVKQFISLKDKYDTKSVLNVFPEVLKAIDRKIGNGESLREALGEVGQEIMPTIDAIMGKTAVERLKEKAQDFLDANDKQIGKIDMEAAKKKLRETASKVIQQDEDKIIINVDNARESIKETFDTLINKNKKKK